MLDLCLEEVKCLSDHNGDNTVETGTAKDFHREKEQRIKERAWALAYVASVESQLCHLLLMCLSTNHIHSVNPSFPICKIERILAYTWSYYKH